MLAFLCGGMEFSPDGGREWRERARLWIEENLHHRVFDPTVEARRIMSAEEFENFQGWKNNDIDRYRRLMRFIIRHDLEVIATQADYVVCYWDDAAARGGGSHSELTMAHHKGLPVYLVTEMPVEDISGWVLGCADRIFPNFEQLESLLASTYGV
jgi:hypothetical protein